MNQPRFTARESENRANGKIEFPVVCVRATAQYELLLHMQQKLGGPS